jgi:hypothetical protein
VTKRASFGSCGLLLLVVAVSGEGCRQVVGIEDAPGTRTTLLACGVPFASATCAQCMATSCCSEAGRCAGAASCIDLAECTAHCASSDTKCTSACRTRLPGGYGVEVASVQSCESAQCAGPCQISCGGYVYPDAACGECGVAHCCAEATACMRDAECSVLAACERQCDEGDGGCLSLCELAHPDGVSKERAFGSCLQVGCKTQCISRKWACLEPPSPPPQVGASPSISITYAFVDYLTYLPVPGLTVRLCKLQDFACTTPLANTTVVTDGNGTSVVRVGQGSFVGYAEITGEQYGPVLIYLPRLSRDFVLGALPLPTKTALAALGAGIVPPTPGRGNLVVGVLDCLRSRSGGVELSIEPAAGSTPFYFAAQAPSATAKATDDGYGGGGFFNVEANTQITVRAKVVENELVYPPVEARVRPGTSTFTYVAMYAEPP